MYGGGAAKGRGESKHKKHSGGTMGGKASRHQVGTSQSGSGPWGHIKAAHPWHHPQTLKAVKHMHGKKHDWQSGSQTGVAEEGE